MGRQRSSCAADAAAWQRVTSHSCPGLEGKPALPPHTTLQLTTCCSHVTALTAPGCAGAGTNGRLHLSLVTYNTVLSACAKAGMFDRAMQLYKQMKAERLHPDIFTLTSLINACDQVATCWSALLYMCAGRAAVTEGGRAGES